MNKEEIVNEIKQSAKADSDLVLDVLENEIQNMHEQTMTSYKNGIDKEVESYYAQEANEINTNETTILSQQKLAIKRSLLQQRNELVNDLFKQVREKVIACLDTDEYKQFCQRQIDALPSIGLHSELHARQCDKAFLEEMLAAKGLKLKYVEIQAAMGGFLISDPQNHFEVDCRLKSRLLAAKKWFEGHSGLTI